MILFREVDAAVLKAEWYKQERGLKAEIVTYCIALLRHALIKEKKDLDLSAIFKNQAVSKDLLEALVGLAKVIRESITNTEFTGGVSNPSEFCKSESGWKKIQDISVDLSELGPGEVLSTVEVADAASERLDVNQASEMISGIDYVLAVTEQEWNLLANYNRRTYPESHKNVGIPRKCAGVHRGGSLPSDRQLALAKEIRDNAYSAGFDFVS